MEQKVEAACMLGPRLIRGVLDKLMKVEFPDKDRKDFKVPHSEHF